MTSGATYNRASSPITGSSANNINCQRGLRRILAGKTKTSFFFSLKVNAFCCSLTPEEGLKRLLGSSPLQVFANLSYRADYFGIGHIAREHEVEIIEVGLH